LNNRFRYALKGYHPDTIPTETSLMMSRREAVAPTTLAAITFRERVLQTIWLIAIMKTTPLTTSTRLTSIWAMMAIFRLRRRTA